MGSLKIPQNVLIIDDDISICHLIEQMLLDAGVQKVTSYQSPLEMFDILSVENFDFVIMDWKLPGLGGAGILNRFREMEYYRYVPIIVSSGFLDKADLALLGENLLTGFLEKPVKKSSLLRRVEDLYNESLWMVEKKDLLSDLFAKMESDKPEGSIPVLEKLLSSAPHPVPIGCTAAQVLIAAKRYNEADHLLISLLRKAPDALLPLHLLGKVKILKKEYADASRILKRAYARSPKNLERLNLIGSAALHSLEYEEAESFFNKAAALDKTSETANSGLKLVKSINEYITEHHKEPGDSLASLLNSIGISHIRNKKYEEGIEFYLATISHLNDSKLESRIQYNIGLGYLRWRKPKEASSHIQQALSLDPDFDKVKTLEKTVNTILDRAYPPPGAKMQTIDAPPPASEAQKVSDAIQDSDLVAIPLEEIPKD